MSSYCQQLVIDGSLAVILAVGLGITYGHGGILSLCHATFFGAGAYAAAFCADLVGQLPLLPAAGLIVAAGVAGAVITGVVVGGASLSLKGDFVALATLAFGELFRTVLLNVDFLGGPRGIRGIPLITTPGLAVIAAAVSILLARIYLQSPWGRISEAIRDSSDWAWGLAVPRRQVRFFSFVLGAGLAGVAGALFAYRQQYIHPNSFGLMPSITILLAVILGGRGNLTGCVLGALVVTLAPESLRAAEEWRPFAMGGLLLATSAYFTHGVLGKRLYFDPFRRWPSEKANGSVTSAREPATSDTLLTPNAVLRARDITVRTPSTGILDRACLEVKGGQPLALVGPNGSGKSIFAKALAGMIPSEGTLEIDGKPIPLYPRPRGLARRILYVPQHPRGFHRLTALDNVRIAVDRNARFPSCLASIPFVTTDRDRQSADAAYTALSWVGLADKAQMTFAKLSYGQRKRVLLATALLVSPEVLILDEPFAGFNSGPGAESEAVTSALSRRLKSDRYITILIDHRLELLKTVCPALALIDAGRIVKQGPMVDLINTTAFQELYERPRA
ncbi:MAG TPA: ATP-binding cassette domain-containing protein [Candidatus Paceibacterota bacterium]|nr:ATP-binding cassette domain-containing protein [Verrucomicrobiota bacterium]HSA12882.1 ATP-binding cassette domain-containing protein [Candidatus Paceibacterota bacterium]